VAAIEECRTRLPVRTRPNFLKSRAYLEHRLAEGRADRLIFRPAEAPLPEKYGILSGMES